MMLWFCFTSLRRDMGGKKAPCLLCLVYLCVSIRGTGTEQSNRECDFIVCLSLELQQIGCALTHDLNDPHVTVDCEHFLTVHGLIPSLMHSTITARWPVLRMPNMC